MFRPKFKLAALHLALPLIMTSARIASASEITGHDCTLAFGGYSQGSLVEIEKESAMFTNKGYRVVDESHGPEFLLELFGAQHWQQQERQPQGPYTLGARIRNFFDQVYDKTFLMMWRDTGFNFRLTHVESDSILTEFSADSTYPRYEKKLRRRLKWNIPDCVVAH